MKINNECARKILFEVEKIPHGETLTVAKLHEKISEYAIEDILGIITLLNKDHYLCILDKVSFDDNDVFRDHKIKCLTEKGYKCLDLIRDDEIWNLMQNKLSNFQELSIYTIFEIANKILNAKQNEILELPKSFYSHDIRW